MVERYEYFWRNGRVHEHVSRKKGNRGRWPTPPYRREELIMTAQRVGKRNNLTFGPQQTPSRVTEALLRFTRLFTDTSIADIGPLVPSGLRSEIAAELEFVARILVEQFESAAIEESQTGVFTVLSNRIGTKRFGEWEVTIRTQAFSPNTKEPRVGADVGVILDLRQGDRRVVKAVLIQAKRAEEPVSRPMDIQDLQEQVAKMRETTDESYGMIFSDQQAFIFDPDEQDARIDIGDFFLDMLSCQRGDREQVAVAQAYDKSAVIDVTVATGATQ